jgi:next-to-BRCA1 protein 1
VIYQTWIEQLQGPDQKRGVSLVAQQFNIQQPTLSHLLPSNVIHITRSWLICRHKLRALLGIAENQTVIFERFSDSAAAYVTLDPTNQHVYKTLFRAAKAKLKLRLRATFPNAMSSDNILPPFQPVGLPGSSASAFPDFARFGSETTLNTAKTESTVSRAQGSTETLIPVAGVEPPKAEAPTQTLADRRRTTSRLSRESFFAEIANLSRQRELALRIKEPAVPATANCSWSVFCNACDKPMADAHYHCNVCDDGDYDLCEVCVNAGIHCPGEGHWLVKRFVKNGQVVNSTTERLSPSKPQAQQDKEAVLSEMPGAYTEHTEEKKAEEDTNEFCCEATRTCNCCVKGK